jgi:hypothetical protein
MSFARMGRSNTSSMRFAPRAASHLPLHSDEFTCRLRYRSCRWLRRQRKTYRRSSSVRFYRSPRPSRRRSFRASLFFQDLAISAPRRRLPVRRQQAGGELKSIQTAGNLLIVDHPAPAAFQHWEPVIQWFHRRVPFGGGSSILLLCDQFRSIARSASEGPAD